MSKQSIYVLVLALATSLAEAQTTRWWVHEHNDHEFNVDYTFNQISKTITVLKGSATPFFFEAVTEEQTSPDVWEYVEAAEIELIDVAPSPPVGTVKIKVYPSGTGHNYGATYLAKVDLSNATGTTRLDNILISGNLGIDGLSQFDSAGTIEIGGDLEGDLDVDGLISGVLTIEGYLLADIDANAINRIDVNGKDTSTHTGNITIDSAPPNRIDIADDMQGDITINAAMDERIQIEGDFSGDLYVDGDLSSSNENDATEIHGDLTGTIHVTGDLLGRILIDGSLSNGTGDEIDIDGDMDADDAAIAIDYDGYDAGDAWASGATVVVGATTYTGNSADDHVYEITDCRADMNNDEEAGLGDINPFVLALNNPGGFEAAYPGLRGSMEYHGDANCDDDFDFGDINGFVQRVSEGCCIPACGDCPKGGDSLSPAELATELAAHIEPELYDDLLYVVAEAASLGDAENRAYWNAVYAWLSE